MTGGIPDLSKSLECFQVLVVDDNIVNFIIISDIKIIKYFCLAILFPCVYISVVLCRWSDYYRDGGRGGNYYDGTDWKVGITGADLSVVDSEDGIENQAAVDFLILGKEVKEENIINIVRGGTIEYSSLIMTLILISFARLFVLMIKISKSISLMFLLGHFE